MEEVSQTDWRVQRCLSCIAFSLTRTRRDECAAGWQAGGTNPFVSHGFLRALEESQSVAREVGWLAQHVVVKDAAGRVLAVAPSYLKSHSQGEYVFDHSWAAAYERNGVSYYPKLISGVPFTPVSGPRLLVRAAATSERRDAAALALAGGLSSLTEQLGLSSAHVNFLPADQAEMLRSQGWLVRTGMQYHWRNRGYSTFKDFEAALSQKRRKVVRQERNKAAAGLRIRRLRGAELTPAVWDAFYGFYTDTVDRKWGEAYLTRPFFDLLSEYIGDDVMLVVAELDEPGGGGPIIGAALNLCGSDAIFGRNWGCKGSWPLLHYEACYYQAIEEAIERGLGRVEAGAQGGETKLSRGYQPTATYSAHYISAPPFRNAIADFVLREDAQLDMMARALHERENPYKDAETTNQWRTS
jgi:uncharacterized protein